MDQRERDEWLRGSHRVRGRQRRTGRDEGRAWSGERRAILESLVQADAVAGQTSDQPLMRPGYPGRVRRTGSRVSPAGYEHEHGVHGPATSTFCET